MLSHPAWGGWIEIDLAAVTKDADGSPTPHGVGGLKLHGVLRLVSDIASHSAWGGWIEILISSSMSCMHVVPLRMGWVD